MCVSKLPIKIQLSPTYKDKNCMCALIKPRLIFFRLPFIRNAKWVQIIQFTFSIMLQLLCACASESMDQQRIRSFISSAFVFDKNMKNTYFEEGVSQCIACDSIFLVQCHYRSQNLTIFFPVRTKVTSTGNVFGSSRKILFISRENLSWSGSLQHQNQSSWGGGWQK